MMKEKATTRTICDHTMMKGKGNNTNHLCSDALGARNSICDCAQIDFILFYQLKLTLIFFFFLCIYFHYTLSVEGKWKCKPLEAEISNCDHLLSISS